MTTTLKISLAALYLVVHAGCENISGGAVELSWKLRPASSSLVDKFVDCDSGKDGTQPVTAIRLDWEVGDLADHEEWSCNDNYGVTRFVLPPGQALLKVTPRCEGGAPDPRSFTAPAPLERAVILGDTVSLGAIELVVSVSYCDQQPCICQ